MSRGQISLEFLVVLVASISILVLFMPIFNKIYDSTLYGLDMFQAQRISDKVVNDSKTLNSLSEGSYLSFRVDPVVSYNIYCQDNNFIIEISHKSRGSQISKELALECELDGVEINSRTSLIMERLDDKLHIYEQ